MASRGVYLLSFLPETDVDRIVGYAVSQGKRSFAALIPDNAYGTVAEAAFKQAVGRRGGRMIALERYPLDRGQLQGPVRNVAQAAGRADAIFIPDGADAVPTVVQTLTTSGIDTKQCSCSGPACGTISRSSPIRRSRAPGMRGPIRPGSAISPGAIVPATARSRRGPLRWPTTRSRWSPRWSRPKARSASPEVLTNSSGFTGIDGLFRFRPDGTNQRGLAVMRVSPAGGRSSARRRRRSGRRERNLDPIRHAGELRRTFPTSFTCSAAARGTNRRAAPW